MNQVVSKFKDCSVEQLKCVAKQLQDSIEKQFSKDSLILEENTKIQLRRLLCRAQEWNSNAFFVIVVGPVKAGKSTLVNLLAHEKVSPTHFLECTVRPSIISRRKNEEDDCTITSYITSGEPTLELVDSIIDKVKGYEFADLEGIQVESPCVLNEESLENKVAYRLGFDIHENGKVALTSITAPGGDFLQKDIYLIDMPGFDGVKANINDSFYEAVISRADLVIFVQSSNSAINKISEEFCSILTRRNASVPMLFIHNYFEAAYWHTEQECNRVTDGHIAKAQEFFKAMNVVIDKDCFHRINLGKVTDARDESFRSCSEKCRAGFDDILNGADKEFKEIEEKMHLALSTSQGKTRLINCINRTASELSLLKKKLEDRVSVLQELKNKYNEINNLFDETISRLENAYNNRAPYISPLNKRILVESLMTILSPKDGHSAFRPDMGERYSCAVVRETATRIIRKYVDFVQLHITEHFSHDNVLSSINFEVYQSYVNILSEPLKQYTEVLTQINLSAEPCHIYYYDISCHFNVNDNIGHQIRRRLGSAAWEIYKQIEVEYVGLSAHTADGYIPAVFLPKVDSTIKEWVVKQYKKYYDAYKIRLEEIKRTALPKLPNENELEQDKKLIEEINKLLEGLGVTNEA